MYCVLYLIEREYSTCVVVHLDPLEIYNSKACLEVCITEHTSSLPVFRVAQSIIFCVLLNFVINYLSDQLDSDVHVYVFYYVSVLILTRMFILKCIFHCYFGNLKYNI